MAKSNKNLAKGKSLFHVKPLKMKMGAIGTGGGDSGSSGSIPK